MQKVQPEPSQSTEPTQKDFNLALDQIVTLVNKQPPSPKSHSSLRQLMQKYVHIYVSSSARQDMFALFCQHQFLKIVLTIVTKFKTSEAYVIVLQSLCMLSYNLKLDRQIVFFLSRPQLHQIIDIMNVTDPEAVDVYVQFLKSFVMRFKGSSYWKIFYNSKYSTFPLMWQAVRFYKHEEKLIRTTVRSIILEVSKIKAFTIQAYMNNFPFCLFYAWQALYIFQLIQSLLKCHPPKVAQALIDDIMDQLTFLQDLSEQLIPQTRAHMWNAFLSFTIRPLWTMFINQQHKQDVQQNFLLLILMIIGQTRDKLMLQIFVEVFLGKWICNPIDAFFNKGGKTKEIESFKDWKKIEKCQPQIQEHCNEVYNKMNTEMFQVSEIVLSQNSLLQQEQYRKEKPTGFFNRVPYIFASMTKDYWINQELTSLSEGLGVILELHKPISSINTNNLYSTLSTVQPQQKQQPFYRRTINPIFNKIQQFIDWDRKSFYVFTQIYLTILSDPKMSFLHKQTASYLTQQLAILMYELSRTKQAKCIVSLLQTLKIMFRIGRPHEMMLEGDFAKLLKLTKDLYTGSMLHVQNRLFNEQWAVHIQAFQQMQTQSSLTIDRSVLRLDISLLQTPKPTPIQKLQAMYFYLIRHIASILNTKLNQYEQQPFYTILNDLKQKSDPAIWAPFLHSITFKCEGSEMMMVPECDRFRVVAVVGGKVLVQGEIKSCTVIKELEGACRVGLEVAGRSYELEFKSPAHRDTWVEGIQTIQRSAYELEIQTVIQMLEMSPV